jgi:hypothetical protein
MYGLDAKTGATVWSTPIAARPAWTPAVSGNRVFLGSYTEARGNKTCRLEASTSPTATGIGASRSASRAT